MRRVHRWLNPLLGALALGPLGHASATELETVAELNTPPGNVAVTPDGGVITSQHQFYQPDYAVVRHTDNEVEPFPNEAWATPPRP